jgi:uncharacterized membrane protein HdeD (DUF308 family)
MTDQTQVKARVDEAFGGAERSLAQTWKFIAAGGILWVAFGFVLVIWPDIGLTTLVALVAVLALVKGVMSGIAAFGAPLQPTERRWLGLEAVVGIGLGLLVLAWPDISAKVLLYVIAGWAIALGVMQLGAALVLPLSGGKTMLLALGGIIAASFGALMFIEPAAGALAQIALISAFAIVGGIMQIGFAFELRAVLGDVKGWARPPSSATSRPATGH